MMQLQINGNSGQVVRLRKPTYLIGRSSMCNLRIPDQELELVHACLKVDDESLTLMSQEGSVIQVNGSLLEEETLLTPGDRVNLGKTSLEVLGKPQENPPEGSAEDEQPEPGWILYGLSRGLGGRRYTLEGARAVVGRARECDICLSEAHLSRRHAQLIPTDEGLWVEDLQSANGTFVNGRRMSKALLKNGDELSLDTVKFRIIRTTTDADPDETLLHDGVGEQRQPPRKPVRPTAIDMQRAALERMDDGYDDMAPATAHHARNLEGGWLTLMTVIVVLAGALWGATSFFKVPF